MGQKIEEDCEICKRNFKNGGDRPAAASVVARCPAPECAARAKLCRGHYSLWVACSAECRREWRKEAAKGLPADKLCQPARFRKRQPKGMAAHQGDMFGTSN